MSTLLDYALAVPPQLDVTWRSGLVRVTGEVDVYTAPQLGAALREAGAEWRVVELDLANVTFFDSTALATVLRAGPLVRVTRVSPLVRRVYELTGLGHLLAEAT